ncbi:hypothetical protein L5G32_18925 [Gordonia sp. HY002]|uniref:hypothetical protein n=1 Tax=Gordonia zhenghanii TaxID=2911516 RepID=UPI001EF113AE|nr:hypothetical protein [Gordonia zhenghanii]MCF8572333.1 hypothetical protein [Gordonia zhenghanii]MCF8607307.1 hypothetical protein [Gordonia zhenghanii]
MTSTTPTTPGATTAPGVVGALREPHAAGRAVLELAASALRPLADLSPTYAQWGRDVADMIVRHDIARAASRRNVSMLHHFARTARTETLRTDASLALAMLTFIGHGLLFDAAADSSHDAPFYRRFGDKRPGGDDPPPRYLDPRTTPRTPTGPPRD